MKTSEEIQAMRNRLLVATRRFAARYDIPLAGTSMGAVELFRQATGAIAFSSFVLDAGNVDNLPRFLEAMERDNEEAKEQPHG